ncbi:MAG: hypothetical protein ABEJ47_04135 [Halorhabdus sp.]
MSEDDTFYCETCEQSVPRVDVIRTETMGGLDPDKWQTFCCPDCGNRLETVFVGDE